MKMLDELKHSLQSTIDNHIQVNCKMMEARFQIHMEGKSVMFMLVEI
uniref:Uncharacterized protein n=1 Tax=Manihot esculenta TaxID=3983 RepID=A0A2C9VPB9_MANES